MKRNRLLNFAVIAFCAVLASIIILPYFLHNDQSEVQETIITDEYGNKISAVCIEDIGNSNIIRYANYIPNEFVSPGHVFSGEIVDLENQNNIASKGSYVFTFLNLNPEDDSFFQKADTLSPFLQGDNNWHFALYLPMCYSSCNIYIRSVLVSRIGDIEDYSFIDYSSSNYQTYTEDHKSQTEPIILDLSFYNRRPAMSTDLSIRAINVTIHYESEDGAAAGLSGPLMIGLEETVKHMVSVEHSRTFAIMLLAAVVCATFLFACLLKRQLTFLPDVLISFGVFGCSLSKMLLEGASHFPYLLTGFYRYFLCLIIFSVICSLQVKIKKFPLWIPFAVLAQINSIIAFISTYSNSAILDRYMIAAKAYSIVVIIALSLIYAWKHTDVTTLPVPILSTALLLLYIFIPYNAAPPQTPVFWFLLIIILFTFFKGMFFFIEIERENRYLTSNLTKETHRQTDYLQNIINERDKLLRYMSHDLKKLISSVKYFTLNIETKEFSEENVHTFNIIENKLNDIEENLNDLQQFSKLNYISDISENINIGEIFKHVYDLLAPDCEASGVILTYVPSKAKVFAKRQVLITVLNNLIFNAIEHAECSQITLYTEKAKDKCKIIVADNGNGIKDAQDIFNPYASGGNSEINLGLGLYICQQQVLAMGGNICYEYSDEKTKFIITLPLA